MQQFYTTIDVFEKEKWNRALEDVPHAFTHTVDHCKSVHINTGNRIFLFLFEKDDVKICCPIMERNFNGRKDIAKPFGISGFTGNGTHPDFHKTWLNFVKKRRYITGYTGLHPLFGDKSWFPQKNIFSHATIQVLNLRPSVKSILKNMSGGRRRQLNKWSKTKDKLTSNRNEIETFFLNYYHDFLDRKNAASYYYFSDSAMKSIFSTENSIMVGALEDNKVVSAAFFGYSNFLADYQFIFSLPGKNHHSADIIWYAILELKKMDVPMLNLGGGGKGISEFKRRFGAYDLPMFSIKEVYDEQAYAHYSGDESGDVRIHKGYFPKYRK